MLLAYIYFCWSLPHMFSLIRPTRLIGIGGASHCPLLLYINPSLKNGRFFCFYPSISLFFPALFPLIVILFLLLHLYDVSISLAPSSIWCILVSLFHKMFLIYLSLTVFIYFRDQKSGHHPISFSNYIVWYLLTF
jgi:hypothetical protein